METDDAPPDRITAKLKDTYANAAPESRAVIDDILSFHLRRDSRWSIAYSEALISSTISVTLQSTDRHHGIVGQERCHNQRDS